MIKFIVPGLLSRRYDRDTGTQRDTVHSHPWFPFKDRGQPFAETDSQTRSSGLSCVTQSIGGRPGPGPVCRSMALGSRSLIVPKVCVDVKQH